MAFDWKHFFTLGEHLVEGVEGVPQEACLRTAVSRAYYAAYGCALIYACSELGFVPTRQPDDHARLRAQLTSRGKTQEANRLHQLRLWRNDCDYCATVANPDRLAKSALVSAKALLKSL
jgi:hypothetical protein